MARKSFQCIDIHQHFVPERYRKVFLMLVYLAPMEWQMFLLGVRTELST